MHGSLHPASPGIGTGAPGSDRHGFIQVGRALAALAVVVVHSRTVADGIDLTPYRHGLGSFGQAGVDLFFVISGFILSMVLDRRPSTSTFVGRRLARIVPCYWVFTIAALVVGIVEAAPLPGPARLARSLLILPQADMPVLGVGWSLEHEVIFYTIAALLLAVRRVAWLFPVMASLSIASVAVHLFAPRQVDAGQDFHLLSLYHVQFFLGVALYRYRTTLARWRSRWLPIVGIMLFPVTGAVLQLLYQTIVPAQPAGWLGIVRVTLWGLSSALVLTGLLAWEDRRPAACRTKLVRACTAIGDASYTLYLSHPIILALVGHGLRTIWPAGWPAVVAQAIAAGAAIGFALLFYRFCEQPLLARLGRGLARAEREGRTLSVPVTSATGWKRTSA